MLIALLQLKLPLTPEVKNVTLPLYLSIITIH